MQHASLDALFKQWRQKRHPILLPHLAATARQWSNKRPTMADWQPKEKSNENWLALMLLLMFQQTKVTDDE